MQIMTKKFEPLLLSALITVLLAGCSNSETTNESTKAEQDKNEQTQSQTQAKPTEVVKAQPATTQPTQQEESEVLQSVALQSPGTRTRAKISTAAGASQARMQSAQYFPEMVSDQYMTHDYNGEPLHDETYAKTKINPVYSADTNPVSTFSVDVDTASYTNVRRFLENGQWPVKDAVRIEEMINYFDYQYPQPQSTKQPFQVNTEVSVSPWNPDAHLMRVALKGYQSSKENLPPMNLTFLVDVSGSMQTNNKLPLLKRAFNLLTRQLRPQDTVSMVVYAGASGVVLEPTKGDKQQEILAALDKLTAGGGTNGGAGIDLAYKTAKANFVKDGINRVILASDGDFNVGTTDIEQLKRLVEKQKNSGVFLSILGFGQGNYNDQITEELSNIGNGNAFYIDSFKEARKVFSDGLTGTMQTIAKDVKVQVEFNPAYIAEYRLIGYDNRQLKREDFKNDKVDAGDIGSGHTVTALYEVVMKDSKYRFNEPLRYGKKVDDEAKGSNNGELAYVKLRYKQPDANKSQLITQVITMDSVNQDFTTASSDFKFASAVAAFGEKLRDSRYVDYSFEQIKQLAKANLGKDTWGYRHEFVQLLDNAKVISASN